MRVLQIIHLTWMGNVHLTKLSSNTSLKFVCLIQIICNIKYLPKHTALLQQTIEHILSFNRTSKAL